MSEMIGLKAQFQKEGATSGTYETVAYVASIQPPQPEREVIEVDELDPIDGIKKKLPGLIDVGDVTITLNLDPTDPIHMAFMDNDFYSGVTKNYRIKLPNGYGWTFPAFIQSPKGSEISSGDVIQAEITLTVTGKPTFAQITT